MSPPTEIAGGASEKLARSAQLFRRLWTAAILLVTALGMGEAIAQPAPPMSSKTAELDPFEQRVREYLLKNPARATACG